MVELPDTPSLYSAPFQFPSETMPLRVNQASTPPAELDKGFLLVLVLFGIIMFLAFLYLVTYRRSN